MSTTYIFETLKDLTYLKDKEVSSLMSEIKELRDSVELSQAFLTTLSHYRVISSSTLRNRESLKNWDRGNLWLFQNISNDISLNDIKELNSTLTRNTPSFRKGEIYSDQWQYLERHHLDSALDDMIFHTDKINCPLTRAIELYIWIATLHPFEDGNGRTSRLYADKELLGNGFLPLCFDSSISSFVANTIGGTKRTKKEIALKTLKAIKRSYQLTSQ